MQTEYAQVRRVLSFMGNRIIRRIGVTPIAIGSRMQLRTIVNLFDRRINITDVELEYVPTNNVYASRVLGGVLRQQID